ncbi:uncharacterized protein LOC108631770 [Ceratina calcarata]|uniref:Uncharacterized protein LOC108631770 n=1 Tax=Ceratina calcarata TaxID=156304 RepID=A0AAJ7NEM4_9HYME|nr:uncharacterized protein LOC108631770 [Ceratina calcarata]
MKEYEILNHMVKAPPSISSQDHAAFYLPHHGVLKPDSTTTKLRVVFNGSNLNEASYQLTTVTYGTKAAPFLAVRTLLQLAEDEGNRFPLAVPFITQARYVDDIFGGADGPDELIEGANQLKGLCMRQVEYRELYLKFMKEYEILNHMVKAPPSTASHDHAAFYLPHHGVLKPDSTTTKLRVVFNGSSTTTSGYSLNDIMHTGANLLLNITDVLLWIRQYKCIFATDITKMYRQIRVHQEDWDLQRILWVDSDLNEASYQLTTVTYGTKAAPFLAVRTLLQLAEDEGHRFPLAVPFITQARYVDDVFGGADGPDELIEGAHQLKGLCMAGGFPPAKWQSNCLELMGTLAPENLYNQTLISLDDCNTKILGMNWNSLKDIFTFTSKSESDPTSIAPTKRPVLSHIAKIFEPLGFLSPVIIRTKMLLHELWLLKINWDDPLPSHVETRWNSLREDLTRLASLSIPRWFNTHQDSFIELHGFSDASTLAMAAVIYVTVLSPSTKLQVTSLVCSKTRVAPLKKITIPRMELAAAGLLAKLMHYVQARLKLNIRNIYLWTDSQVTLTWIKSHPSRWKDYVRNRVTIIQELTAGAHWRYVPGTSNPADCASRGLTTHQLGHHDLWWTGPPWLTEPSDSWPTQPVLKDDTNTPEARPGVAYLFKAQTLDYHWDLIHRYSTLKRLITITGICYRFISRLKGSKGQSLGAQIYSVTDLELARVFWIKATQSIYFAQELKTVYLTERNPTKALLRLWDELRWS